MWFGETAFAPLISFSRSITNTFKVYNFDPITIKESILSLEKNNLSPKVLIDCSHGNSKKKQVNQPAVFQSVLHQRQSGQTNILGMMLESNLEPGNQPLSAHLQYGVSVTDECMGWDATETLIRNAFS